MRPSPNLAISGSEGLGKSQAQKKPALDGGVFYITLEPEDQLATPAW